MMNRNRREELRRLAGAATPGPWYVDSRGNISVVDGGGVCSTYHGMVDTADVAYMAAVDPPTTVELLDALDEAEGKLDRLLETVELLLGSSLATRLDRTIAVERLVDELRGKGEPKCRKD